MSVDIAQRAAARFAELRHLALASTTFDAGQVAAPAGWCISAVARIGQNDPAMLLRLAEVQHALAPVAELYAYAAESLHISLLGCTQREPAVPTGRPMTRSGHGCAGNWRARSRRSARTRWRTRTPSPCT
jgi:hypothetical protein